MMKDVRVAGNATVGVTIGKKDQLLVLPHIEHTVS